MPPPPPPPIVGPRRAALRARRREEAKKKALGGSALAAALSAIAIGIVAVSAGSGGDGDTSAVPRPTATERDPVATTLVFGTKEHSRAPEAVWMTLLSYDPSSDRAAVVYVPAHASAEVPGRGPQPVGETLASGGIPLLLVSTENMLGIEIDRYLELSDRDARLLFTATGPISVDVPSDVRISAGGNTTRVIFEEGVQKLPAPFLVQLLYTRGLDTDDIELGGRHVSFWDAFLEAFRDEPGALRRAVTASAAALRESDADPSAHADLLATLASLDDQDRIITTLPAHQVSVGGSELYQIDQDEIAGFLHETLGSGAKRVDEIRVQILNGNGVPGIGQEAAERLVGHGFRVILTGNARRLNYAKTLIITYDSTTRGQALAERARELLGVGEVQVSVQQQGIVDLTIVVGEDFLRTT